MVFSSMLFVFLFLTLNLLSQIYFQDVKKKNIAMLVFSLVFYSWSGPRYLILLAGMTFICWLGALLISSTPIGKVQKRFMIITVALCLIILGVFKYTGFFLTNIQGIFGVPKVIPQIVLPIGISFYTFQLISYVVDVYRGEVRPQRKYWMLLLYASLFHQCIAGPIVRYQDVAEDIRKRKVNLNEISAGISRFTVGLAKKAVLANGCAAVADSLLSTNVTELAAMPALGIFLGGAAFTLQIYLDFSAYSDMAIGMGLMCGFHYKENFNYPYISDSIREFWRRWHISLSTFFRDYVYIPLGGNRCDRNRQIFNLFVVWGLTGLWHGASWNFVLWGLYWFVFLMIERFFLKPLLGRLRVLPHLYLILVVFVGWILFRFTDVRLGWTVLRGLFGLNGNAAADFVSTTMLENNMFLLLVSAVACTPLPKLLSERLAVSGIWDGCRRSLVPILLLLLSTCALVGESYNPFLYFQF